MLDHKFNEELEWVNFLIGKYQKEFLNPVVIRSREGLRVWKEIENGLTTLLKEYMVLKGLFDLNRYSQERLMDCYHKFKQCTRSLIKMHDDEV